MVKINAAEPYRGIWEEMEAADVSPEHLRVLLYQRACPPYARIPRVEQTFAARANGGGKAELQLYTVGVVCARTTTKLTGANKKFVVWTLCDLVTPTVLQLFVFEAAHTRWLDVPEGAVVAVIRPDAYPQKDTTRPALRVSCADQILRLGTSSHFGRCTAQKADGSPCALFFNKSKQDFCELHSKGESVMHFVRGGPVHDPADSDTHQTTPATHKRPHSEIAQATTPHGPVQQHGEPRPKQTSITGHLVRCTPTTSPLALSLQRSPRQAKLTLPAVPRVAAPQQAPPKFVIPAVPKKATAPPQTPPQAPPRTLPQAPPAPTLPLPAVPRLAFPQRPVVAPVPLPAKPAFVIKIPSRPREFSVPV
eukprot:TRINITY_DN4982_c0_g1_i1.p1 TRINITY_DN4982_c0_g1~~TRINITY_DN4982_c0_g1_i1.p1  ORF type:complete len:364 (-),score=82.73 TRINITY_DN4982_c0_g1_i1:100-1191(-)